LAGSVVTAKNEMAAIANISLDMVSISDGWPCRPKIGRPPSDRQAETVRAKRVRRSLSEAKAKTDRRRSLWAKAGARFASYGSASHAAIINGKDSGKADAGLAAN
jgi:hypothetical protein